MLGIGWGAAGEDEDPGERDAPLTMWMVWDDWILYTESTSSSWGGGAGLLHSLRIARNTTTDFEYASCGRRCEAVGEWQEAYDAHLNR